MGFFSDQRSPNMRIKKIILLSSLLLPLAFSVNVSGLGASGMSDSDISNSISTQLKSDATLNNTAIQVRTNNNIVSLYGTVGTDAQADRAIEIAQSTPGVKDVNIDNLQMNGSKYPVSDAFITAKIKGRFLQEKLFTDKDIASMSVSVETNNGVVELSGKADNLTQVKNAIKIAQSVDGVNSVNSHIQVTGMAE